MREMVERVALAILNSDREAVGLGAMASRSNVPDSDGYVRNAIAAINVMRDPTDEMLEAAVENSGPVGCCCIDSNGAMEVWQTMIDAAIGEQP